MADNTKKFEVVKTDSIVFNGKTLYRIRALRSFNTPDGGIVFKGDLGGFVESENNLSQEGACWIFDNAKVYDDAKVYGYAQVFGKAQVQGSAEVDGCAQVFDNAWISDKAKVNELAQIFDNSKIFGNAKVHGKSYIFGDAVVCDDAEIFGNVEISGTAIVFGVAKIRNTKISGNQKIKAGEFMYDAVDITTLLPKVQAMHKQVLRMSAGKYLIDENYLDNIIKEFNEYDKARKVKEELYLVALPLKAGEVCALLEEISNALEKIKKSKRFNKEVDNQ